MNAFTTFLDPVVIILMLGLSALLRRSIWLILAAAIILTIIAVALDISSNPLINFSAAAFWGTIGYLAFRKRTTKPIDESNEKNSPDEVQQEL